MVVQIIRPATVCGCSPRMRLDVSVNLLTMQALSAGRMTVFGGGQIRPNIHIHDITGVYLFMLAHPELSGVYNAGFENMSIMEIARRVAGHIDAEIVVTESSDPRSYRVNSDKLLATGFRPSRTVDDAIADIRLQYEAGELQDDPRWHNLRWMRRERA
jgi:nucleoside-diphosphate-sugar epimerase